MVCLLLVVLPPALLGMIEGVLVEFELDEAAEAMACESVANGGKDS
jgi:hypothetical protein